MGGTAFRSHRNLTFLIIPAAISRRCQDDNGNNGKEINEVFYAHQASMKAFSLLPTMSVAMVESFLKNEALSRSYLNLRGLPVNSSTLMS